MSNFKKGDRVRVYGITNDLKPISRKAVVRVVDDVDGLLCMEDGPESKLYDGDVSTGYDLTLAHPKCVRKLKKD